MEKLPQQSSESQNKSEKITFAIDEKIFDFEIKKSNFEYPKNIQNETGILGYERNIISKSDLEQAIKDFKGTPEVFSERLLLELSNGQFPKNSFNYVLDINEKEKAQFVQDKFLLQEIFGQKTFKELSSQIASAFDMKIGHGDYSVFTVIDRETNKEIDHGTVGSMYKKYADNAGVSITSGNGLNVREKAFYFDYSVLGDRPAFGFFRKDKFFQKYISASIERLREINKANSEQRYGYHEQLFGDRNFLELFAIKESESLDQIPGIVSEVGTDEERLRLYKKYGSPVSVDDPSSSQRMENFKAALDSQDFEEVDHHMQHRDKHLGADLWDAYHIPIFVNDKTMPQLKWGHASFAVFSTENGFNFLKIKHSEKNLRPDLS